LNILYYINIKILGEEMKEFSRIREDDGCFIFDYWADSDPSGELHNLGAILVESPIPGDSRIESGMKSNAYCGVAEAKDNTEISAKNIQTQLIERGWKFRNELSK